jgi:DNA-binding transcriptional LysR family regulator
MHAVHLLTADLNLLPVLRALLETRSIKDAGAAVGLSPSATSHALGRLRELLGDPLLVRAGRSMQLTPRAEALAPRLHKALLGLERALEDDAPFQPGALRRAFRIATTDYVEMVLAPGLGGAIHAEAPGVDLHFVREGNHADALRSGTLDLSISPLGLMPEDVQTHPLFEERFVCVMRAEHPALKRRLTARRYAALEHVLVAPRGGPRGIVDDVLGAGGMERRVTRTVASFTAAPFLIRGTDLVLTVASRLAASVSKELGLTVVDPPIELPGFMLGMSWHRRHDTDPAHGWLRQHVVEAAQSV